ncbi:alpha/beta fold hydrolase [Zunongwangia sp. H14]|uniref:alpha/beta fold hydrolase n=1 Tax=Zunongwangia sp. H14 TaxID=3240792 RepID=UPI003567DB89
MAKDQKTVEEVVKEHELSGKYFEVEGIRTFALDFGKGEAVVCVHGVPTSSFLYRKVLKSLAEKNYRAVSIDLPGLGLSARPENFEYNFESFAAFLSKAVQELQITKFHLVVHDIGGPVGFAMAAKNMEKVLSLSILNTWVDVVNFKKPLPMRPFEKKILGQAELKMLTRKTWPLMFSTLAVSTASGIPENEIKAYVDLLKREDNGKAFLKIMRNFASSKEFQNLCLQAVQNTPYPIQAIWGKDDPGLTYERYGKEIKEYANLETITLLSSRHLLQEEVWEEIAAQIDALAKKAY